MTAHADLPPESTMFEPAYRILVAEGSAARARILLQLSDVVIAEKTEQLRAACAQAGFVAGCQFLFVRVSCLCATRDRAGRLSDKDANLLELWRAHMTRLAMGGP